MKNIFQTYHNSLPYKFGVQIMHKANVNVTKLLISVSNRKVIR